MINEVRPQDIAAEAARNGLKMNEVCKEAGVSHSSLSRALNGKSSMTGRTINKLLRAIVELSESND